LSVAFESRFALAFASCALSRTAGDYPIGRKVDPHRAFSQFGEKTAADLA